MKNLLGISILVALMAFMVWPVSAPMSQEEEIEFVGSSRCKMCHNKEESGKFFDNWEQSKHGQAFDTLSEEEQKNEDCQSCHTTGYGQPGGFVSLEETDDMVHVQCESCHGPGGEHIKSAMRNRDDPDAITKTPWEPTEELCVKCHNEESPTWDPERFEDEDGNKAGFIYDVAFKMVNHAEVYEALGEEPPAPLESE